MISLKFWFGNQQICKKWWTIVFFNNSYARYYLTYSNCLSLMATILNRSSKLKKYSWWSHHYIIKHINLHFLLFSNKLILFQFPIGLDWKKERLKALNLFNSWIWMGLRNFLVNFNCGIQLFQNSNLNFHFLLFCNS